MPSIAKTSRQIGLDLGVDDHGGELTTPGHISGWIDTSTAEKRVRLQLRKSPPQAGGPWDG